MTTEVAGQSRTETTTRVDLLENLLAHRRDGAPLLVPLVSTGAFMWVLAAVAADQPVRIDPRAIQWQGDGQDRRAVVEDVEHWVRRAASSGRTFTELRVPWAHVERDRILFGPALRGSRSLCTATGEARFPPPAPVRCCTRYARGPAWS